MIDQLIETAENVGCTEVRAYSSTDTENWFIHIALNDTEHWLFADDAQDLLTQIRIRNT